MIRKRPETNRMGGLADAHVYRTVIHAAKEGCLVRPFVGGGRNLTNGNWCRGVEYARNISQPPLDRVMNADKDDIQKRLRRIEGKVRGLQRMVEEDRYCGDILQQIASVQKALRSAGKTITRGHLETCVTDALRSGDRERAEETYDEVMDLLYDQIQ